MASALTPAGPDNIRARREQGLFEAMAPVDCQPDLVPASRLARRHRLWQTLAAIPPRARPARLAVGGGPGCAAASLAGSSGAYGGSDDVEPLLA
ncbi:MAG TPA: hypothetical protein VIH59_29575 [Candidatus Tectomicrobia bacterium]|jgi:hypothetical protein